MTNEIFINDLNEMKNPYLELSEMINQTIFREIKAS